MFEGIRNTMSVYPRPWWIAGGWAIDLHLGRQHRLHKDVDIAVLRRDQNVLRSRFSDWSLRKVVNGAFESWTPGEILELPIHEVHAKRNDEHLEFLLNESNGDAWLFRRNRKISMPLERVTRLSAEGIPYLSPELVLLYKAKTPRTHDVEDFERTHPTLDAHAKQWLLAALSICHPEHQWTEQLRSDKRQRGHRWTA